MIERVCMSAAILLLVFIIHRVMNVPFVVFTLVILAHFTALAISAVLRNKKPQVPYVILSTVVGISVIYVGLLYLRIVVIYFLILTESVTLRL